MRSNLTERQILSHLLQDNPLFHYEGCSGGKDPSRNVLQECRMRLFGFCYATTELEEHYPVYEREYWVST